MRRAALALLAVAVLWATLASAQGAQRVYLPVIAAPPPTPTASPTSIPTATPPPTATSPAPRPAEVLVLSSRSYVRSSLRYVVGELLNNTDQIVFGTQITARFYDAGGQLVATDDGYSLLDRMDPGTRVPFLVLLSNPPASITRYELTVAPRFQPFLQYRSITVASQQVRDNFGPEVFGEVRNTAEAPLRGVEVAVTFYDAAGAVVDVDSSYASTTDLAVGATSTYSIKTFDRQLVYARYEVRAEGYIAP
jgi:hypothetical protein